MHPAEPQLLPEEVTPGIAPGEDGRGRIADLRGHTARGMIINGAFQVVLVGVSALRGLVVAAFLTRAEYGIWGIVGLTLWTSLGFKTIFGANDKYIQQSEDDQELAFQRAFTVEAIYTAGLLPVSGGLVFVVAAISGHPQIIAPGLALLLLLPAIALQFPIAVFMRRMDYRRQRLLECIEPLGGAIVMIGLAACGAGYWSFVIGSLFGSWATAVIALRRCPYRLALRFDLSTLRRYFGFSFSLFIAGASELALFYVIILVGAGPLGLAGIGAFTLVGNIVQFTDQADGIITETLYPAVCAVSDRIGLVSEIFVKSNRLSLMWALPFGIGLSLFGSDLFRFCLGPHWLPALPLLQIMGVVTAVNHVGYNWSTFVKARGETWPIAACTAIVGVATVGSAVPLMFSAHLLGIGYAFIIGQVVSLAVRAVLVARLFNGIRLLTHLLRSFLPTAVAAAAILGIRAAGAAEHTALEAVGLLAIYVAVTILATLVFERSLLAEALGYMLRRRRAAGPMIASTAP